MGDSERLETCAAHGLHFDPLQETIVNLAHENELLKRRIYGNKTERLRISENQLALGNLLYDEKQLQAQLAEAVAKAKPDADTTQPSPPAAGEFQGSCRLS